MSRGTTLTGLEGMSTGGLVRRDGKLIPVAHGVEDPAHRFWQRAGPDPRHDCSVGRTCPPRITPRAFPTSKCTWRSSVVTRLAKSTRYFNWLLRSAPLPKISPITGKSPCHPGPQQSSARASTSYVWGGSARRRRPCSYRAFSQRRMGIPDRARGLAIVDQVLSGRAPIGFQTPAKAYGSRVDLHHRGRRLAALESVA